MFARTCISDLWSYFCTIDDLCTFIVELVSTKYIYQIRQLYIIAIIITGVQRMSLMSTHPLRTKGQDGQLHIMASIITGALGMSLMSTHPLGTKRWDGQLYIVVNIIIDVQGMSLMSTHLLGTKGLDVNYI